MYLHLHGYMYISCISISLSSILYSCIPTCIIRSTDQFPSTPLSLLTTLPPLPPTPTDPTIGQAAGFGGVILHGLSTYGFAARAIVSAVGGGDAHALRFFGARFTSPVRPGDVLETMIWEVGPVGPVGSVGGDGPVGKGEVEVEVAFVTKNVTTGKVCLGAGVAYVKKAPKTAAKL